MHRIESLLSARLFIAPQIAGDRLYFISNLSGHLSLYAMDFGGSVPEPLLPPHLALQNPHLLGGYAFYVFPQLSKILVMLDQDGDENYQPMWIPLEGGFPEPAFNNFFASYRVHLGDCDREKNLAFFAAESRTEQNNESFLGNLETGELVKLGSGPYGKYPGTFTRDYRRITLVDTYSAGDLVLYLWEKGQEEIKIIAGTPIEQRKEGQQVPLLGIRTAEFTPSEQALLVASAQIADTYGLGTLSIDGSEELKPVEVAGLRHSGVGELNSISRLKDSLFLVEYNIDGASWLYEAEYDENNRRLTHRYVLCGEGLLSDGVLESVYFDKARDTYILSFATATSPTQIYTITGPERSEITLHTREKVLGIQQDLFSPGEDASYTSFDGTRISARLYLPSEKLGYEGPRPLVYYIHGGPQSQERPDFAWFSMPLIQFLTLNGFAVFVPNVRGSTGYGLSYTKQVDRDWGGQDRLDHVHAMTEFLPQDSRLDVGRAGVVGRSYGGYMTLTLSARHPELWSAAVDMFGPFDLLSFLERIPPTWKPYFAVVLGDADKDLDFLVDRSPRTHIEQIQCPLLVIQGKNDPRVVERESHDLVEYLRSQGKEVEYLMFENEGHDVLKYENRVTCYNTITDFFKRLLIP